MHQHRWQANKTRRRERCNRLVYSPCLSEPLRGATRQSVQRRHPIRSHNNRINFNARSPDVPRRSLVPPLLISGISSWSRELDSRARAPRDTRGGRMENFEGGIVPLTAARPQKRATEFETIRDRSVDRSIDRGHTSHSTRSGDRCARNIICSRGVVSQARRGGRRAAARNRCHS